MIPSFASSSFEQMLHPCSRSNMFLQIMRAAFWRKVEELLTLCTPAVVLLRLFDSGVPMTGKVYANMLQLEEDIQACGLPAAKRNEVLHLLRSRWEMMDSQMHSAGFVLDPEYQDREQHTNEEVMEGL